MTSIDIGRTRPIVDAYTGHEYITPIVEWQQSPPTRSLAEEGFTETEVPTKVRSRLRKLAGPVRAVARMAAEDRCCADALHHVAAVEVALEKFAVKLCWNHGKG